MRETRRLRNARPDETALLERHQFFRERLQFRQLEEGMSVVRVMKPADLVRREAGGVVHPHAAVRCHGSHPVGLARAHRSLLEVIARA